MTRKKKTTHKSKLPKESWASRITMSESKPPIFYPVIKDKKCKHTWKKLKTKCEASGFLVGKREIEFEYFLCLKCGSTQGDIINA